MWLNLEKFVPRCPTSSHRCIPIMTQRKALQTRILKMENYEKCWCHHCTCRIEGIVSHLEYQLHWGNLLHCFHRGSKEPRNQFKSSVFKDADPSNQGRSLLEANKDHLLSQARSELVKQEHQVGSLNNCISELQQQTYAPTLELQDAQHEFF